uniref:hypothetical protein n=1 Tax=Microbacterium proteolyticum TaxID=1572644 RepID=UPI0024171220|nr:hypothetical protein [Microbacterium proteolyticum]
MSAIITFDGGAAIFPELVLRESYAARSESGTRSHDILDGPPVYTLRPAGPDTGMLAMLFAYETPARDCYTAHKLAATFTIADTTAELLNFEYVVIDRPEIRLDGRRWIVSVPFQVVI